MNRKAKNTTTVFILLSLAIHFGVATFLTLKHIQVPAPPSRIEVEYTEPPAPVKPAPSEATDLPPPKPVVKSNAQIVEQQKQLNQEIDPRTRFLSAFNQKVEKQTRARESGKFSNKAKGGLKETGQKAGKKEKLADKKVIEKELGELPELKELTPKFAAAEGPIGPTADKAGEASATDDYMKDVATGMQTLLSTREFVYYSYYNRIKESLRQHWEPNVREKVKIIYRQGRSIASAKDRVTQVMVTLDPRGELIRVELLTKSGIVDLDGAALQAFKDAAPFPNPPKGMIEADGTIKIRWDFVLEV